VVDRNVSVVDRVVAFDLDPVHEALEQRWRLDHLVLDVYQGPRGMLVQQLLDPVAAALSDRKLVDCDHVAEQDPHQILFVDIW
jgi:hypothetical protein